MLTRYRMTALIFTMLLLITLTGFAAAQSSPPILPNQPEAVNETIPNGFTYQGYLDYNGVPVDGTRQMIFSLWDAETGGNQIGGTITEYGVKVVNGRFRIFLNGNNEFGEAFIGQSRWLQIGVSLTDGTFQFFDERQPLSAVPYALGLKPGAEILGEDSLYYALYINATDVGSGGGLYSRGSNTGITSSSLYGTGVYSSGGDRGVRGFASATDGIGVFGTANVGQAVGVYGSSSANTGVYGNGGEIGVWGEAPGTDDIGVYGVGNATGSVGVWGTSAAHTGVFGRGGSKGIWGQSLNTNATGIYGEANAPGSIGVWGHSYENTGVFGDSWNGFAIWGESTNSTGVYGRSYDHAALGVFATGPGVGLWSETTGVFSTRVAVVGDNFNSDTGWAGYFYGNVNATGTSTRAAGGFTIDHPLDPANMTLSHSTVESPEMKTVYDGTVITDANGSAVVQLPAYMEALNHDFRYQLTVIGVFAQAIISQEIADNQFSILTDQPNVKVSWQVTGIRRDPYTNIQPLVVEQMKPEEMRGFYWQPQAYGLTPEMGMYYQAPAEPPSAPAQVSEAPQEPQVGLPEIQPEPDLGQ